MPIPPFGSPPPPAQTSGYYDIPYYVKTTQTYHVPVNLQLVSGMTITIDGTLQIDGIAIWVL